MGKENKKQEGLFKLHNGDLINLSSVESIRFSKSWKTDLNDMPANILIERRGYTSINIEFDNDDAAKKYREELGDSCAGRL